MADLRVELLVVEDCPHASQARADLESVLGQGVFETPVQHVIVGSQEDAEFLGFPGSPTVRIDGDDVVPQPELAPALACRFYRDAEGRTIGSPSIEAIRAAVEAHRRDRLEAFRRQEARLLAEAALGAEAEAAQADPEDDRR